MKIAIVFPVLNEERRLKSGIERTIAFLEKTKFCEYKLIIADNGSIDRTHDIATELCDKYPNVYYIHTNAKGVGLAFREAVKYNNLYIQAEYIGYMDIDLSTDIGHINDVCRIFKKYDSIKIVNGSRLSKDSKVFGKRLGRRITSHGLNLIIRFVFQINFSDPVCGFKFFETTTLNELILISSNENGWFYMAELLIRAERLGYKIQTLPVIFRDDPYNTKVNVAKQIRLYLKQIIWLYREFIAEDAKNMRNNRK